MDICAEVKRVFEIEMGELERTLDAILPQITPVIEAVYACRGRVVLCGMGKAGHVARKISATMASVGIPSYFLHPAEGLHGDLGILCAEDVILLISNSGSTAEVCNLLPNIKMIGAKIIGITSNAQSEIAQYADISLTLPAFQEAERLNLAPTSSTTAQMAVGDAIAVVVSQMRGFQKEQFALFHPAGALGKKLLTRVCDIMHADEQNACIPAGSLLTDGINEMTKKGLGAVSVVDAKGKLCGIITDGDLRRAMQRGMDIYQNKVDDVMTKTPRSVPKEMLAVEALKIMEKGEQKFSVVPVVDRQGRPVGMIRNHDILQQNIFL